MFALENLKVAVGIAAAAGLTLCSVGFAEKRVNEAPAIVLAQAEAAAPTEGEPVERTTMDGVYTEEQAARGEPLYTDTCARCHGNAARGGADAPGIIADVLYSHYEDAPIGMYVEFIRTQMPKGRPMSLSVQEYVDVTAYLLKLHGYPAGSTELPADEEGLNSIIIKRGP